MLTIRYPVLMNVPELNEYEIEEIRTALSQTKENDFDGVLWEKEPDFPSDAVSWEKCSQWTADTWSKFDTLPIDCLGEQTGRLEEIIALLSKTIMSPTVGHIYEVLSAIESTRKNSFSFEVTSESPNEMTLACMKATQDNKDMHGPFNSVDELMEDLNADY